MLPPPPRSPLFPYTTLFRSLSPFIRSAYAESNIPTGLPPSPLFGVLPFTQPMPRFDVRSEEHTSELQSLRHLVCRLLLEKKKKQKITNSEDTANHDAIIT